MILLIDNYDSFTYNLYQYMGQFESEIQVVRNDEITVEEVLALNPEKIVISPGPKTPNEAGNCVDIIKRCGSKIPILGICLGHQSIGSAFGATITYAKELYHGKTSDITHNQEGIFKDLPSPMTVARYHSLVIQPDTLSDEFEIVAMTEDQEIMAIQHKEYPIIGLQFHPESIFTPEGIHLIKNFIREENIIC